MQSEPDGEPCSKRQRRAPPRLPDDESQSGPQRGQRHVSESHRQEVPEQDDGALGAVNPVEAAETTAGSLEADPNSPVEIDKFMGLLMKVVQRLVGASAAMPTQGGDEGPQGGQAAEAPTEGRKCVDEAITSVLNVIEAVGSLRRLDSNEGGSAASAPHRSFFVSGQTYNALFEVARGRPAMREATRGRSSRRAKPETTARKILEVLVPEALGSLPVLWKKTDAAPAAGIAPPELGRCVCQSVVSVCLCVSEASGRAH